MHLLYISKNTIEIFKKYQKVGEVAWTPENLSQTLSQIKNTFSSKFRIILSDDFISVSSLLLPPKESKKRSQIQAKFQPTISQDLSQTVWDYKIVARHNHFNLVQLIFTPSKFFDIFRQAIVDAKIKIDLLESFSTVICRFLPAKELTFLVYQDLLVLSFNRTPVYTHLLTKKFSQSDIDQVFEFTRQHFQTLPQQILFSPTGDIAFNQFNFNNLQPTYTNINPLKGIIHSTNSVGSDAETSRLEIPKNPPKSSSLAKLMFFIPLIILLSIVIFVVVNQNIPKSNSNSQLTPTPTAVATPTPKPVSSFKIQVLNGTGTSGEAGKVTDLLAENNFKVESVGNASNYDFTQTQIEIKASVPQDIVDLLKKSLNAKYPPKILDTNLDEASEFDIIITTGR